tara:strand:+ start:238 stop:546 length:309 start_codon:yes stop_codon:yes gene_type:complete
MKNNQDEIKKQIYEKTREYLPGTTVAQVKVEVSLHRAYIDLKTSEKIFELVDMHSERFDARVDSDDAYEARDIMRKNIIQSCSNWDSLPNDKNANNETDKDE